MLKGILRACGIVMLCGVACKGTPPLEVNSLPEPTTTKTVIVDKSVTTELKVRVEFVFAQADVKAYPDLFKAFVAAINEWAAVAPIEAIIMVPIEGGPVNEVDIRRDRHGVVLVNFTHKIPSDYQKDDNKLGVWYPEPRILSLDLDDMYKDDVFQSDMARAVSLHEIGHVFGLPHIGDSGDINIKSGDLVVQSGGDRMLMYPYMPDDPSGVVISSLEAKFATRYLLLEFSRDF